MIRFFLKSVSTGINNTESMGNYRDFISTNILNLSINNDEGSSLCSFFC